MEKPRLGLGEVELETPIVAAAGLINGPEPRRLLRDVQTLAETAIGAITVGSWTIPPQAGNAARYGEPTDYFDRASGEMTNSLGLPNLGLEVGEKLVPELIDSADGKPVIFSVSPTLSETAIGDSVEQSLTLVRRLFAAGADWVELNVSCPNLIDRAGGREPIMGHDPETMSKLAEALAAEPDADLLARGLGLKLPAYIGTEELINSERIKTAIRQAPIGFIVTSNTIPGQRPVDQYGQPRLSVPGGIGAGSGPATKAEGRRQLAGWLVRLPETPILSGLGVFDGQEVAFRRALGAVAVEMHTRFWQSSNWQRTLTEVLIELSDHIDDDCRELDS